MKLYLPLLVMLIAACTNPGGEEKYANLRNHASFDLRCPADQVSIEYKADDVYSAKGCGMETIVKVDDGKVQ